LYCSSPQNVFGGVTILPLAVSDGRHIRHILLTL